MSALLGFVLAALPWSRRVTQPTVPTPQGVVDVAPQDDMGSPHHGPVVDVGDDGAPVVVVVLVEAITVQTVSVTIEPAVPPPAGGGAIPLALPAGEHATVRNPLDDVDEQTHIETPVFHGVRTLFRSLDPLDEEAV